MLIGILAPMPEEIDLIVQRMQVDSVYESGKRKFYRGKLSGKECVVALSRIGKVASSVTAAVMIEQFHIDALIVCGVAGAIAEDLNLGDIVIASETVQHDLDARPLWPQFEAPLLEKSFFQCDASLVSKAVDSCREFLATDFYITIDQEDVKAFSLERPLVYIGQVCCGDQFISSFAQLNKIRGDLPGVLCVEMEAGAVGQVCYEYAVPFVVIRTISDAADDHAPINFALYIQNVAKHYTYGIINKMLQKL